MANNTSRRGARYSRRAIIVTLMLLAAGAGWWIFWPGKDPAISVPDRVCDGSIDGDFARKLLPERGDGEFKERTRGADFAGLDSDTDIPICYLSGGERRVRIYYNHHMDYDDRRNIDPKLREAKETRDKPEMSPLTLGEATGYASDHGAVLLLECPKDSGPGLLEAVADDREAFPSKNSDTRHFAALAAETLRFAAQNVINCEGADNLPDGPPKFG